MQNNLLTSLPATMANLTSLISLCVPPSARTVSRLVHAKGWLSSGYLTRALDPPVRLPVQGVVQQSPELDNT
jgi:hypothetical protein